jgi:hypothetical protein
MWKWMVVAFAGALLVTSILVTRHYKDACQESESQSQGEVQGAESPIAVNPIANGNEHQDKAKNGNCKLPWWYVLLAWPEGITTCALLLTLGVIAWQTYETRRAAQAGLLNAQAVINSERAWMVPKIAPPDDREIMSLGQHEPGWELPIQITFTNRGQTPARVVRSLMEHSSEKIVDPKDLNVTFDLPGPPKYIHDPGIVAPGAVYVTDEETSWYRGIPKDFLLAEKAVWQSGEKCLCIKGFIEYVDAFQQIRTTRFCYAYQKVSELRATEFRLKNQPVPVRQFRKARPDAYNEFT